MVINLSEGELHDNEINLLRKGMNFVITPRNIPIKQIIASVEEGISELPQADKNQIRSQVYSTIKEARPPVKKNISRKEKKAMNDIKGDNDIVIIKADQGNAVVVMDRKDYEKQTKEILDDQNIYEVITDKSRNPTSKTELELQRILLKLRKSENLTEREYWKLRPFDSYPAAFYCLPKVHKIPLIEKGNHYTVDKEKESKTPMRPITSCIGSPTYAVSKNLALLKHLYDNTFSVKNSEEFVNFVSIQKLKEDELVVSFDVVSLFTSVPVEMAVDVVREKLGEIQEWKNYTKLTEDQVCHLCWITPILNSKDSTIVKLLDVPWAHRSVQYSLNW